MRLCARPPANQRPELDQTGSRNQSAEAVCKIPRFVEEIYCVYIITNTSEHVLHQTSTFWENNIQQSFKFFDKIIGNHCDNSVNRILNKITNQNVEKVATIMKDFDEMEISLKSLMRQQFTKDYPKYMALIHDLQKGFNAFKSNFEFFEI